jgi:hypothetical protein
MIVPLVGMVPNYICKFSLYWPAWVIALANNTLAAKALHVGPWAPP